jgi:hypothetical protein
MSVSGQRAERIIVTTIETAVITMAIIAILLAALAVRTAFHATSLAMQALAASREDANLRNHS